MTKAKNLIKALETWRADITVRLPPAELIKLITKLKR